MRLRFAILLVVAGIPTGAAAPALAAESPVPEASDFTQPLPEATQLRERSPEAARTVERQRDYGTEGPLLYRTPPIEAPRRFDLVGVAGEMRALEYRARRAGEGWSRWAEADNGDPVFTGPSDEVQVRSRGVPIEGRLAYVDVDGGAAPRDVDGGAAARRTTETPRPDFVSRSQWGANDRKGGCLPRQKPDLGRVKAAVVHHTVSTNGYSEAQAPGLVLGICRYHRDANGWDDIGYNALVDRFGNLYEGRDGGVNKPVVGAQTEGHNLQTAGVAVIGDRSDQPPSGAERRTLVDYLAWRFDVAGIAAIGRTVLTSSGGGSNRTPNGKKIRVDRILSHSDTNFTECAGSTMRALLPKIRRAVQARMAEGGPTEPVEPPAPPSGAAKP